MNKPKVISDFTRYLINSNKLSDADLYKILDLAQDFIYEMEKEENKSECI
jgi:hypothetical protein